MIVTRRRLPRPRRHRNENDAHARAYGGVLREHLASLADEPSPLASLHGYVQQMHEVAVRTYPAAFIRGKRQAIAHTARTTLGDQLWIDRKLDSNRRFLGESFLPDVVAKIHRTQLHLVPSGPRRRAILDRSFGYRLERLYGGNLWTVAEAGFRSGAESLSAHLLPGSLVQELPALTEAQKATLVPRTQGRLAYPFVSFFKHLTRDEWTSVVGMLLDEDPSDVDRQYFTLRFGLEYHTSDDKEVCVGCAKAAGEYFPPEQAPLPGEVCAGGPNCRCWLQMVTRTES